jgi:hypothetical protein
MFPAPVSSLRSGCRTKRMKQCAISFVRARQPSRIYARSVNASRALSCGMAAAIPAPSGKKASCLAR